MHPREPANPGAGVPGARDWSRRRQVKSGRQRHKPDARPRKTHGIGDGVGPSIGQSQSGGRSQLQHRTRRTSGRTAVHDGRPSANPRPGHRAGTTATARQRDANAKRHDRRVAGRLRSPARWCGAPAGWSPAVPVKRAPRSARSAGPRLSRDPLSGGPRIARGPCPADRVDYAAFFLAWSKNCSSSVEPLSAVVEDSAPSIVVRHRVEVAGADLALVLDRGEAAARRPRTRPPAARRTRVIWSRA